MYYIIYVVMHIYYIKYKGESIMKPYYTFSELLEIMEANGSNLADIALGRMMDEIEYETGEFPAWYDIAPDWVVCNCLGK